MRYLVFALLLGCSHQVDVTSKGSQIEVDTTTVGSVSVRVCPTDAPKEVFTLPKDTVLIADKSYRELQHAAAGKQLNLAIVPLPFYSPGKPKSALAEKPLP